MLGLTPLHRDSPLTALRGPGSTHDPARSYRWSGGIPRSLPPLESDLYALSIEGHDSPNVAGRRAQSTSMKWDLKVAQMEPGNSSPRKSGGV